MVPPPLYLVEHRFRKQWDHSLGKSQNRLYWAAAGLLFWAKSKLLIYPTLLENQRSLEGLHTLSPTLLTASWASRWKCAFRNSQGASFPDEQEDAHILHSPGLQSTDPTGLTATSPRWPYRCSGLSPLHPFTTLLLIGPSSLDFAGNVSIFQWNCGWHSFWKWFKTEGVCKLSFYIIHLQKYCLPLWFIESI